jgi:hypothetical protein
MPYARWASRLPLPKVQHFFRLCLCALRKMFTATNDCLVQERHSNGTCLFALFCDLRNARSDWRHTGGYKNPPSSVKSPFYHAHHFFLPPKLESLQVVSGLVPSFAQIPSRRSHVLCPKLKTDVMRVMCVLGLLLLLQNTTLQI